MKRIFISSMNMIRIYVLWIFGLNKSECESLKLISDTKKKYAYNWYFNNVVFSLIIIFTPFLFTIIHRRFGTLSYEKDLLDIALSGSLSLTGLNILRSASTMIAEKLDESKMYENNKEAWSQVKQEIFTIKNKLNIAVFVLTIAGTLSYLFQVTTMVNRSDDAIYWFLFGFVVIFLISVLIGRSLHLMNTNFTDNEDTIRLWHNQLQTRNNQMMTDVGKQAREGGL